MTAPGGGRAAIEIIGDVRNLGPQVERDVQRALDGVDVDTTAIADDLARGFREGAHEGVEALQEVDRQAQQSSKKVVTSVDAAGREVKRTFQTIAKEGKVTTTVVEKSFDAAGDEIERTFKFTAVDVAESAALMALVNREAADSAADTWERAGGRIERAFAEARREVVVDQAEMAAAAVVAGSTVGRQGGIISRIFSRVGESITSVALSLGEMAAADLNPVGLASTLISLATTLAVIAALVGPILTVSAAIAQLAGALALLPSAGFAAASAIGVLVIAFHGFGDAIGAVIEGDPEKIAEALKKLAPEARGVVLEFQKLLPQLRELGQLVQQRFFIQLEGDLTRLSKNLLPTFRTGLANIATELGDVFSQVLGALSTPTAAKQFATIFDELATSLDAASTDFARLVSGLLSAAAALAPSFGDIATTLSDIVGDFGDWLRLSAQDGSLQTFLDNAIATGKSLFRVIGSVISLIKTLFGGNAAEEGRNFLDTIANGINQLNEKLQSPEGQAELQKIISSVKEIGKVFLGLVTVIGFLIDVSNDVQETIADIGDFFNRAGNDIARFWEGLKQGVSDAYNAVVGFFTSTGSTISDWWDGVTTTVGEAVDSIVAWFQALPGRIVAFIESIPDLVVEFFNRTIDNVIDIIGTGIGIILALITEIPNQLLSAGAAILNFFTSLWDSAEQTTTSAIESIGAFIASVPDRLAALWDAIAQQAIDTFNSVRDWAAGVVNGIVGFFSTLPGKVGAFFASLYNAAVAKLDQLREWVRGLPGRILSALGDLGSLLFNAGAKVIQGLIDGIASKFQRLKEKISEGVQLIRDHLPFSPAKMGPLSGGGSPQIAGAKIAEMIAAGLDSGVPLILGAAGRAAGAAQVGTGAGATTDAGGLPLVTPQSGQPGTVLAPVAATVAEQNVFIVQIGDEEIEAYIDKRVDAKVDVEVRRLMAGTRGV